MFAQPWWLLLMVIPLGLIVWYWRCNRVDTVVFSNPEFKSDVMPAHKQVWRRLGLAAMLIVMFALPLAVAQPTISTSTVENRTTVMITLDVSTSMTAKDVAPTRLDAAKAAIATAVSNAPADLNIGLVTLADNAKLVVSPTRDREKLLAKLTMLKPEPGGTATGEGVFTALTGVEGFRDFGGEASSFVCSLALVSDGAEEIKSGERSLGEAVKAAKAAGCSINTVSYGTDGGTFADGSLIRIDPGALAAAAKATGGTASKAGTGNELEAQLSQVQAQAGVVNTALTLPVAWALAAALAFALLCAAFTLLFIVDRR